MRPTQQEFASPRDWLLKLAAEEQGYSRLVADSGGMGRAAYRLARAQSSTQGTEPCLEDLQAAAALLASRLGGSGALPIQSLLPSARSVPPPASSLPPPAPSTRRRRPSQSRPRGSRASV